MSESRFYSSCFTVVRAECLECFLLVFAADVRVGHLRLAQMCWLFTSAVRGGESCNCRSTSALREGNTSDVKAKLSQGVSSASNNV